MGKGVENDEAGIVGIVGRVSHGNKVAESIYFSAYSIENAHFLSNTLMILLLLT